MFYARNITLNPFDIQGFIDSDQTVSICDRQSTSGYYVTLGGNTVIWKSEKQHAMVRSNTEAEFRVMAKASRELVWMKILHEEIRFQVTGPMKL